MICDSRPDARERAQPSLPAPFVHRLAEILPGEAFEAAMASFSRPPPTAFRPNTLKTSAERLLHELNAQDFEVESLECPPFAFCVAENQRRALTESTACREGRLYLQNPSSMLPPLVLNPRPGEEILDLTAAPGSKTLQMAAMMGNVGRIAAVEVNRGRFFRLRANLHLHGASIVQAYLRDGREVWRKTPERFDRVLVDAPCSSEGRFRIDSPDSFAYWKEKKITEMARKQRRLLLSGLGALKPGGVLVYSTCSFAPEENEAIISHALERFPGALAVEETRLSLPNISPGLLRWRSRAYPEELQFARRIIPDGLMEGFFICRLRKLKNLG